MQGILDAIVKIFERNCVVSARGLSSFVGFLYLKEFTKFLDQASKAKFDQLLIVGDFNLPNFDWATVTASTDCQMYTIFTKAIKDHFLWQLIDFPTRNDNLLDLLLTNIPDKDFRIYFELRSPSH